MSRRLSMNGLKNVKRKISAAMGGGKPNSGFEGSNSNPESPVKNSPNTPIKNSPDTPSKQLTDVSFEEDACPQTFVVQYLGYVQLKLPGFNEICENVDNLYRNAKPYLKTFARSLLTLSYDGIRLKGTDIEASSEGTQYKPRRILYCGVDKQHQRVFSFNYQYGQRADNIHLHVVVCKTKEDSKMIAKKLANIFKMISKEMHRKEKEDKKQHTEGLIKLRSTTSNSSIPNYTNMPYRGSPTSCSSPMRGSNSSIDRGGSRSGSRKEKDDVFVSNGSVHSNGSVNAYSGS